MNADYRSAANLHSKARRRAHRRFPDRHRDQRVQPAGPALGALPARADVLGSLAGRAMVIGVDRLDYSKGLPQRMDAFERFLARLSGLARQGDLSADHAAKAARKSRNMSRWGGPSARPPAGSTALMAKPTGRRSATSTAPTAAARSRAFTVPRASALVTPLRDGMNLVAKEYVAAQDPEDPGVLILSRFAGAAAELTSALLVNPAPIPRWWQLHHRSRALDAARGATPTP